MTTPPILHTCLSREATADEIAADGLTLSRMRDLFPTHDVIMSYAPRDARARIADWVLFVEEGFHHCETLAGMQPLLDASNALSALEISPDLTGVREKISAAFRHIETAASALGGAAPIQAQAA